MALLRSYYPVHSALILLKVDLSLAGEDCQHAVTDESLCTVTGCALGTDVYHWMFKTKVNMVQGQEDGPLTLKVLVATIDEQWEGMGDVG